MAEKTPVFLDSPMAIKTTMIFKQFPNLFSKKLKQQVKTDDPFDFPSLVLCESAEKSKQIRQLPGPKIIVAGSGMMNGGRILHHAADYLGDPKTQLVFVGYQAEGTMGRAIKDGTPNINVYGREIDIRAQIIDIESMSAHADQTQLLNWLKKIWGLRTVILTHGEELPRLVLMEKIRQMTEGVKVELPTLNDEIELKT
jgi:metallo-beta-lactamase family protein